MLAEEAQVPRLCVGDAERIVDEPPFWRPVIRRSRARRFRLAFGERILHVPAGGHAERNIEAHQPAVLAMPQLDVTPEEGHRLPALAIRIGLDRLEDELLAFSCTAVR